MATRPNSTAQGAPSTLQTVMILLTPVWVILATIAHALVSGEVAI